MSRVEGLEAVLDNLNSQIAGIEDRTLAGLWDAGLQIQRLAQQELRASVVTGNLRASAYTRRSGQFVRLDDNKLDRTQALPDPSGPVAGDGVEIGFTAVYARVRHEDMEGRAPKFLEAPILRNQKAILDIIAARAKV